MNMGSYYVDMQHDNVDMQLTYVTLRLFFFYVGMLDKCHIIIIMLHNK